MNSIEDYKNALSRFPEKKFFEIARNMLGNVKTPYNKQNIIENIVSFLSNKNNQDVVLSFITDKEKLLITSIELLNNPSLHELSLFCEPDIKMSEFENIMLSLEERLIVYFYSKDGSNCAALNPVLEDVLSGITHNTSVVFPHKTMDNIKLENKANTNDERILLSYFTFINTGLVTAKSDAALRKSSVDKASAFFAPDYFIELTKSLAKLRLIRIDNNICGINESYIKQFFKLRPLERLAYIIAANGYEIGNTGCLVNFLSHFENDFYFTECAARRILFMILINNGVSLGVYNIEILKFAFESMVRLGILSEVKNSKDKLDGFYFLSPEKQNAENDKDAAKIIFDSAFTFIVMPYAKLDSLFPIIHFAVIEDISVFRFEITRESASRCFENGCSADWIIETLSDLSQNKLNENLIWSLKEWEKRNSEVVLHEGLFLYLSGGRKLLAETKMLKPFLLKEIADGVFIADAEYKKELKAALQKSGVDIIGKGYNQLPESDDYGCFEKKAEKVIKPLLSDINCKEIYLNDDSRKTQKQSGVKISTAEYKKMLYEKLNSFSAGDYEKKEILARIERGLIINEEQIERLLQPGVISYERLEASGMDYSGKLGVAKNALSGNFAVEISIIGKEPELCLINEIVKSPKGDLLKVSTNEGYKTIPLSRIGVIRKIKRSIFE